jgi:hypothetical protein
MGCQRKSGCGQELVRSGDLCIIWHVSTYRQMEYFGAIEGLVQKHWTLGRPILTYFLHSEA